jgi:uncharacterized protein
MRVLIGGATGFVGRALTAHLIKEGFPVRALVRDLKSAREILPASVEFTHWDGTSLPPPSVLADVSHVVNLAGESIFKSRWSPARKVLLRESRIRSTKALRDAIRSHGPQIRTFITASAMGYYGDRGEEVLTEDSGAGDDFLAQLCVDWEAAARGAGNARSISPRFGLVIGPEGGMLAQLKPLFSRGLGGRLGHGRQWMSWIQITDLVRLFHWIIVTQSVEGPINAASPLPVRNLVMTQRLAEKFHRPAFLHVPKLALKLAFGELGQALLTSQRLSAQRIQRLGFEFLYPDLDKALDASL